MTPRIVRVEPFKVVTWLFGMRIEEEFWLSIPAIYKLIQLNENRSFFLHFYWSSVFLFCRTGFLAVTSWEFGQWFLQETANHNKQRNHNTNIWLQIIRNHTTLSLITAKAGTNFGWMSLMNSLQFLVVGGKEGGALMLNAKASQGLRRSPNIKRKGRKKLSVPIWWVFVVVYIACVIPWWGCGERGYICSFNLSCNIVSLCNNWYYIVSIEHCCWWPSFTCWCFLINRPVNNKPILFVCSCSYFWGKPILCLIITPDLNQPCLMHQSVICAKWEILPRASTPLKMLFERE